MVDEVKVTDADGFQKPVATDTIGGKEYQRIKPTLGPDGIAVDADVGQGPISDGTQRVTLARDDALLFRLSELINILGTLSTDIAGRLRVVPEGGIVGTVSAVTSLSNQANVGNHAANQVIPAFTLMSEADLRRNIVIT